MAYVAPLRTALQERGITILRSDEGLGATATAVAALERGEAKIFVTDGDWHKSGYLAGFAEPLLFLWDRAEAKVPDLITHHEQTLKRVWPRRNSSLFNTPRDLTNTATREERTRFYHHEYQNKLLVGLAEFMWDALRRLDLHLAIVIDNSERLSPTSKNFLGVLRRRGFLGDRLVVLLIERSPADDQPDLRRLALPALSEAEFGTSAVVADLSPPQRHLLYERSGGNSKKATALLRSLSGNFDTLPILPFEVQLDISLSSMSFKERLELAREFVAAGLKGDLLAHRNFETFDRTLLDELNLAEHYRCIERHNAGIGPLVINHALALSNPLQRAEALVEPSEALMGIGLYDSWFAYFAQIFGNPSLRRHGSGDGELNGLFINAAFVLYAMGRADAALPFLKEFLDRFPHSRYVPTALYAQSMIYGRYQVPVDLNCAEDCALKNLELIDQLFFEHPRYMYIKVFAENAYAYIKARQGKFAEALQLCESGIEKIVDAYGEDRFKLHRSILIYNTSQVYELVGEWSYAEARLREAIAYDPFYAEYHNDLGNLLSRLVGRQSEALACYERAIELSPPYYEAHLNRGMLRLALGDPLAGRDFRRVLEIKPDEWRAMRELGNLLLGENDSEGALRCYHEALQHQPHDADLNANFAVAASNLGRSELAVRHARTAIASNPHQAGAHSVLAFELVQDGQLTEALHHARASATCDPDSELQRNVELIETLIGIGGPHEGRQATI